MSSDIRILASKCRQSSLLLGSFSTQQKNHALDTIAAAIKSREKEILKANQEDCDQAVCERLAKPLIKRLQLDERKLETLVDGIHNLIQLPDPVGRVLRATRLDVGLDLYQETCPIGVIGVIFESRPDALVQISTLCLKSGNGVILKGGREAARSNRILYEIIRDASKEAGCPESWIQLIETRAQVQELLELDEDIDLIIPRGSNEFVRYIMDHTRIPVLGHADGICHIYVAEKADCEMAVDIVVDAKCQYVAVCNALETLLVHQKIAPTFLPRVADRLLQEGVELRGCKRTLEILPYIHPATEEDWSTEYLDLILSIKIVDSLEEALDHINHYGSGHTDSIITADQEEATMFMNRCDSANVFWNASTRFSDGYRYGLGAEVGISTQKIHARGPVGLEGLVIYKWKLFGNGHTVAPYVDGRKRFLHTPLK